MKKKKTLLGIGTAALLASSFAFGISTVSTHADENHQALKYVQRVHLNLNGVDVSDPFAHKEKDTVYGSIDTFAKHYNVQWTLNKNNKQLKLDGKPVTNKYGVPKEIDDVEVAPIQALAEAIGITGKNVHFETGYNADTNTENVAILPKGVENLEGHFSVPMMGEHWVDTSGPITGPIWGTYQGKLVFLEYMPDNDLNQDVTLDGTKEVPIPPRVDHTDINWNPQGHPGDTNPHHDVHMYFISKAEQEQIK